MNLKRIIKNNIVLSIVLVIIVLFAIAYYKTNEGFQQKPLRPAYIPVVPDCNKVKCKCPKDYEYDSKKKACLAKPICPPSGTSGKKKLVPVFKDGVCNTEFSVEV
jgi:hypothetical protein